MKRLATGLGKAMLPVVASAYLSGCAVCTPLDVNRELNGDFGGRSLIDKVEGDGRIAIRRNKTKYEPLKPAVVSHKDADDLYKANVPRGKWEVYTLRKDEKGNPVINETTLDTRTNSYADEFYAMVSSVPSAPTRVFYNGTPQGNDFSPDSSDGVIAAYYSDGLEINVDNDISPFGDNDKELDINYGTNKEVYNKETVPGDRIMKNVFFGALNFALSGPIGLLGIGPSVGRGIYEWADAGPSKDAARYSRLKVNSPEELYKIGVFINVLNEAKERKAGKIFLLNDSEKGSKHLEQLVVLADNRTALKSWCFDNKHLRLVHNIKKDFPVEDYLVPIVTVGIKETVKETIIKEKIIEKPCPQGEYHSTDGPGGVPNNGCSGGFDSTQGPGGIGNSGDCNGGYDSSQGPAGNWF